MRGCLSIIVLGVVFIIGATWLGGPSLAAAVVQTGLSAAGLHGSDTTVKVEADPPLRLLVGRADRITVTSDDATLGDFEASHVRLVLGGVNLLDRSFETIDGTLDGVAFTDPGGTTLEASSITVSGPAGAAPATIHVPGASLTALALDAISDQIGIAAGKVTLTAPDRIGFSVGGLAASGQLAVLDGGLYLNASLPGTPRIALIERSQTLRLTDVAIVGDELVLSGVVHIDDVIR